jgi:hypothetical protein
MYDLKTAANALARANHEWAEYIATLDRIVGRPLTEQPNPYTKKK